MGIFLFSEVVNVFLLERVYSLRLAERVVGYVPRVAVFAEVERAIPSPSYVLVA